jgi:LytS/YehU family sensor histidine kinase
MTSFSDGLGLTMAVSGFAAVIKLMKTYYIENSENERLQQQKTIYELHLLKSQLNSRFLFNTLRSIRQHVRNQSQVSSSLILKLSDLLSYVLYENDETSVLLRKEIEIIREYLELEKKGHNNAIDIQVTQHGEFGENKIVPLVLLPLVESCFEHSSNTQKKDACISLDLRITKWVLFVTINIDNMRNFNTKVFQDSLRIKNVKQRLNFYYTDKHQLEIVEKNNNYILKLEMGF